MIITTCQPFLLISLAPFILPNPYNYQVAFSWAIPKLPRQQSGCLNAQEPEFSYIPWGPHHHLYPSPTWCYRLHTISLSLSNVAMTSGKELKGETPKMRIIVGLQNYCLSWGSKQMPQLGTVIAPYFTVTYGFNKKQRRSKAETGTCSWPIIFCSALYRNASTFTGTFSTTQNPFPFSRFSYNHFRQSTF